MKSLHDYDLRQINAYETEYLFAEIFQHRTYLKHGIELPEAAVVLDIGANIGLFTLFIKDQIPNAKVFAFEPSPETFDCLHYNVSKLGDDVKVFNLGVYDHDAELSFTYYPGYTVLSGFRANRHVDAKVIIESVRVGSGSSDTSSIEAEVLPRFDRVIECKVPTTTVSQIIRDQRIAKIDLLKIDAERSELPILRGIEAADWAKIQQVILEVHDPDELPLIRWLLEAHGFEATIEQEPQLAASGISNIYARQT